MFKTAAISDPSGVVATDDSQTSIVIGVSIVVSIAVLGFIAFALYLLMKRRKRYKRKAPYPQFVPGLEDLIEMRRRSHSGGAEPRGHRDLLELGKLNACGCLSHDFYLTWVLICFFLRPSLKDRKMNLAKLSSSERRLKGLTRLHFIALIK